MGLNQKRWQDAAASKLREAQDLRVYTAITLMENFTDALNVLFDEILILREEAIVFPTGAPLPFVAYHEHPSTAPAPWPSTPYYPGKACKIIILYYAPLSLQSMRQY